MVEYRVDAPALVDVLDPARRYPDVLPYCVHPHGFEVVHLGFEGFANEIIRLFPQHVVVILTDGHVSPVHSQNHEIVAVYFEFPTLFIGNEMNAGFGLHGCIRG